MEYAIEIGLYRCLPILHREFGNGTKDSDACVIDQNIQPASEMRVDKLEQLRDLIIVLYIGGFALDFTGRLCAQFANCLIDCVLGASTNRNARSFYQQHPSDSSSNS